MAKSKKAKSSSGGDSSSTSSSKKDQELRDRQKAEAAEQNLRGENAVPEKRPIASQVVDPSTESETARKVRELGLDNAEPMGQDAYDKADSDSQAKAAAKESRSVPLSVGQRVQIVEGKSDESKAYAGNFGSIVAVDYASVEDERLRAAGTDESRFAEVSQFQVRTRGGRHALLFLNPDEVKPVGIEGYGRGEA